MTSPSTTWTAVNSVGAWGADLGGGACYGSEDRCSSACTLGQCPGDPDVDMGITGGVGDPLELVKTVSGLGVRLGLFRLGETLGSELGLPHLSLHHTKRVAMW